jgi:hypothetical protein
MLAPWLHRWFPRSVRTAGQRRRGTTRSINATDYFQFLARYGTRLNADGTTTSIP